MVMSPPAKAGMMLGTAHGRPRDRQSRQRGSHGASGLPEPPGRAEWGEGADTGSSAEQGRHPAEEPGLVRGSATADRALKRSDAIPGMASAVRCEEPAPPVARGSRLCCQETLAAKGCSASLLPSTSSTVGLPATARSMASLVAW